MTTPPCPRCGAPLVITFGFEHIRCCNDACAYGIDAPRAMVPQPDPPKFIAPSMLTPNAAQLAYSMWRSWNKDAEDTAHPAPTPAANTKDYCVPFAQPHGPITIVQEIPADAKSAGVDEGMRERVLAVLRKDMPGEYSRMVRLSDDICAAILASHEIVRRLQ